MTGVPSIVAGLFIYSFWILALGFQRSPASPARCALAILMIPVVVRSTEEMLKLVPNELREASLALGVPQLADHPKVVLPTALPRHHHRHHAGVARVIGRDRAPAAADRSSRTVDQHQPVPRPAGRAARLSSTTRPARPVRRRRRPRLGRRARPHRHRHDPQPGRPAARSPRPQPSPLRPQGKLITMAKRIDVSGLNVYYGAFLAVEDISMTVEPRSVTAFIGPSGCGKSTFLRTLNRMHEVIPGGRVEGKVMLDDEDIYGGERRPGQRAPHDRHGLPAAEPVPDDVDLRQRRRPGLRLQRRPQASPSWTTWSRSRCRAPTCGTRSRTG